MAEHQHSVTCPACGGAIDAATQAGLIEKVPAHASTSVARTSARNRFWRQED
jgi:hypothetical protein